MFNKLLEAIEKANVREKLKSGKLSCPDCGGPAGELPQNLGDVIVCGLCGGRASLIDWAAVRRLENLVSSCYSLFFGC
jgi:hypothetical protein